MPKLDLIKKSLPLDKALRHLIEAAPTMPIDAGSTDRATADALESWLATGPAIKKSCLAGLWLLAGDLDRSHRFSQDIETPEGSYWHSIMHRREGDYANATYWMSRVGDEHWVSRALASRHLDYTGPFAFIDWIERASLTGAGWHSVIERIQWLEWQLLFEHCWLDAQH